ncbi:MAG: T9SS type A sorting domain-containing protein [Flavobacterium sp.]|nr:T9SS type A sorting domain-containing protein [Flavobacterium sp.]
MKKIICLVFLMLCYSNGSAQLSNETVSGYGKLNNMLYDATIQNKIYASTQGNHILVSVDNAATWEVLYSLPKQEVITQLSMLPGNESLVFSTNKESMIYVYNLTSNAITAQIPVPPSNVQGTEPSSISAFWVYDATAQTIIVNTSFLSQFSHSNKVFYSTNAGQTWDEVYFSEDHGNIKVQNVAISPNNPSKLFIARSFVVNDEDPDAAFGGMLISTDAGATWTESLPNNILKPIAFHPTNPDEIFTATFGSPELQTQSVYKSADGGVTWTTININFTDEYFSQIQSIAYNPANPNHMIMLEDNEVLTSFDGGNTWQTNYYNEESNSQYYFGLNASFNPFDTNQVLIANDYYPQASNDGGNSMTQLNVPFRRVNSVATSNINTEKHLYYDMAGGKMHKDLVTNTTEVYGVTPVANSFSQPNHYLYADPLVSGRVFSYRATMSFGGQLKVSFDNLTTEHLLMSNGASSFNGITVDPANSNVLYIALTMYDESTLYKVDFSDLENVISEEIATPETFSESRIISSIIADDNGIYIAKSGKIFKLTDNAATWVEKTNGLSEADMAFGRIYEISQNPLNGAEFMIATDFGVYKSSDSGDNWTLVLADNYCRRIKYSPTQNQVIVASKYSNTTDDGQIEAEILYSQDNGQTWTTITSEMLDSAQSYSMDYIFEDDKILVFLATPDLGVLKYEINDLTLGTETPTISNHSVTVFPNPTTSHITIQSADHLTIDEIQVFSAAGRKVSTTTQTTMSTESWSNGLYFVRVKFTNGSYSISKIIKN